MLGGSPVTALSAAAGGDLIVAAGEGDLALVSETGGHRTAPALDALRAALAAAFLAGTSVIPGDGDHYAHLVVTDGLRTWEQETW